MINEKEVIAQPTKKHNVIETTAHSVKQIKCQQGVYHRRMADVTVEGIHIHCKECRRMHLVTWEQLALLQQEFRLVILHSPQVS